MTKFEAGTPALPTPETPLGRHNLVAEFAINAALNRKEQGLENDPTVIEIDNQLKETTVRGMSLQAERSNIEAANAKQQAINDRINGVHGRGNDAPVYEKNGLKPAGELNTRAHFEIYGSADETVVRPDDGSYPAEKYPTIDIIASRSGETQQVIFNKANPLTGVLEKFRNPAVANGMPQAQAKKIRAEGSKKAKLYERGLMQLMADEPDGGEGLQLCQAKIVMDARLKDTGLSKPGMTTKLENSGLVLRSAPLPKDRLDAKTEDLNTPAKRAKGERKGDARYPEITAKTKSDRLYEAKDKRRLSLIKKEGIFTQEEYDQARQSATAGRAGDRKPNKIDLYSANGTGSKSLESLEVSAIRKDAREALNDDADGEDSFLGKLGKATEAYVKAQSRLAEDAEPTAAETTEMVNAKSEYETLRQQADTKISQYLASKGHSPADILRELARQNVGKDPAAIPPIRFDFFKIDSNFRQTEEGERFGYDRERRRTVYEQKLAEFNTEKGQLAAARRDGGPVDTAKLDGMAQELAGLRALSDKMSQQYYKKIAQNLKRKRYSEDEINEEIHWNKLNMDSLRIRTAGELGNDIVDRGESGIIRDLSRKSVGARQAEESHKANFEEVKEQLERNIELRRRFSIDSVTTEHFIGAMDERAKKQEQQRIERERQARQGRPTRQRLTTRLISPIKRSIQRPRRARTRS